MSKVTGAHKANADYRAQEASDKGPIEDRTTTEGTSNAARLKDMKNRLSEKLATLKERDPEVLKEYFGNKTAQVMGKEKWYKKSDKKILKENVERQIFRDLYEEVRTDKKIYITENKELGWFKRRADVKKQKKEAKQEIKNNKKELKELFKKELSEGSLQSLRKTISDTVDQRSEEIKNVRKKDFYAGLKAGGIVGTVGAIGTGIAIACTATGVLAPIGAAVAAITALITTIGSIVTGIAEKHAVKQARMDHKGAPDKIRHITLKKVLNPQDQKTSETSSDQQNKKIAKSVSNNTKDLKRTKIVDVQQNPQEINPTTADITAKATTKTNPTTAKNTSGVDATNAVNDISKVEGHQFACPMLKEMSEAVDYCMNLNTEVEIKVGEEPKTNTTSTGENFEKVSDDLGTDTSQADEVTDKAAKTKQTISIIQTAEIFDEIADKITERKKTLEKNQRSALELETSIQNYENTKSKDDKNLTETKKELESLEKQIQEDIAYINAPKEHLKKIVILSRPYCGDSSVKDTAEDPLDPNLALSLAQGKGLKLYRHKEEIGLNLQKCDEAYSKLEISGKFPEEANKTKDKLFEKLWNEDSKEATNMDREQYVNQKISNIKENNNLANVNEDQLRNFIDAVLKLKGE